MGYRVRFDSGDIINTSPSPIVHIHLANQALNYAERGIPYAFTIHDVNPFVTRDALYKKYVEAVNRSVVTFVPGKFIKDDLKEIDKNKIVHIPHGVDPDIYTPIRDKVISDKPKLLCVGKTSLALQVIKNHPEFIDRKGFGLACEIAQEMNLPITIAGPNEEWIDSVKDDLKYPNLNIINRDVPKNELLQLYREHDVFLHLSLIETGQPCLVILEAMACGVPAVTTLNDDTQLPGMENVSRDKNEIKESIEKIIENYQSYSLHARETAKDYSWFKICEMIEKEYLKFFKDIKWER